jgi:hypothetical protein
MYLFIYLQHKLAEYTWGILCLQTPPLCLRFADAESNKHISIPNT